MRLNRKLHSADKIVSPSYSPENTWSGRKIAIFRLKIIYFWTLKFDIPEHYHVCYDGFVIRRFIKLRFLFMKCSQFLAGFFDMLFFSIPMVSGHADKMSKYRKIKIK